VARVEGALIVGAVGVVDCDGKAASTWTAGGCATGRAALALAAAAAYYAFKAARSALYFSLMASSANLSA
jgi:hypothetical protein